jgi:hypothetical protein
MRRLAAPLLIFLVILTPLVAYSVYTPLKNVDPVAVKPVMIYSLGKNNIFFFDQNEVRSASLSLSGTTITGATVVFYKRTFGTYLVRTTVTLLDANGNTMSTGTVCGSYTGTGVRTATITSFSPAVSIDSVYRVNVAIQRVASCV